MSAITDVKYALTQKALDAFCTKYHILEEVHPVLPNQNDTMHERLAGKIRLYTRFFDYANFRLPLSTFLVDILRHFRINISQLSVIRVAKVSHFEILCRVYGIIPTIRDMDIFAFIHTPDPTKVKIIERERNEDEPLLLQTTVGCTVPLLPAAPDRAESKLEASVDRLFDEGGSGNQTEQGGFAGSGRGADIQLVSEAMDTVAEDVAPLQPRRQRKRKTMVVDLGEASHPPKKLREDHGTPSGPSVAGKSRSTIQRLLVGSVLNPNTGVTTMSTFPFITSSVSVTPEHEGGDHTDSVPGLNLHTIRASRRFFISSDSSHHSGTNVAEAEVDSLIRYSFPVMTIVTTLTSTVDPAAVAKEKPVEPLLFGVASSSAGGTDPTLGGFLDRTGSDFLIGGIRTVIDPDTDL
ncbi:hypothetical protein Tco_0804858 [Tanacetum coccineum]